jgi:molybdate transport system substrate-binding protein
MRRWLSFPALLLTCVASTASAQERPELTVWTARALATVLAEVGHQFEQTSGYRLKITTDLPAGFARRVSEGEPFDLLITASATLDAWIQEGRLVRETRTDLARSGIGVAVRAGAAKPDLSTTDAFKGALLNARSIAFLPIGSGLHVASLIEQMGIRDAVMPKVIRPDTDIVCELVARGEVDLGMVVITQILTTPGVELAGPLPPGAQAYITFSGAVSATSKVRGAALQLMNFLKGDAAREVMRRQGMEPAAM